MKRIFLFGMLAAFLVCGCKKNDEPVNPNNPDTPVADPEGTITANISETTHINVPGGGTIAWVNPNNFSLSSNSNTLVSICDMGAMKGLGNIVKIPETGYTIPTSDIITDVASQIGHGYVIKFERQSQTIPPVFVRLYVEEPITNAFDEILGVKVKYQYPFESTMLTVSADSLSFPANGGTKTLDITTDAAEWSYTCSDTWIQADQQGNKLSVTVASDEYQGKTGIIIITANERQQTVIVSVSATTLTVSKEVLNFPANGGTETVIVTTDASEWSYTCSDSWIQADQQGNKLSVTVASDEYQGKTGIIIITANERQQTVIVSVSATTLTVSKEVLNFPANGGTETVIVTTDASEWSYTCSDSWIQADQQGNRLSVTVAADEHSGKTGRIIITANEIRTLIAVSVDPTMLTISKEALNFPAIGGTESLTIITDAPEWSYTCSDSWIEAVQQGNRLYVSLAASNFILEQTGSITVSANEQSKTITVKQAPTTSTVPPYNIGDIYVQNGVVGVVYQVSNNGYSGMIVSLNETSLQWATRNEVTGCTDADNGMNNMNTVSS